MFDVLSDAERAAVLAANPDSYLHVVDAASLQRLLDLGAYADPVADAAYVYRMGEPGRRRTGVVALVSLAGFADGRVLGHEAVQPDRVERLAELFGSVPCRSDLVSLVHRDDPDLAALTAQTCAAAPDETFTDVSGVEQSVWRVADADRHAMLRALAGRRLYVADGHHRVAAALLRWERDGRAGDPTVPCAIYAEEQVRLYAFHRRVRGPLPGPALVEALARGFAVRPADGPTQERGVLGLYVGGRWLRAEPLAPHQITGAAGLDATLLDEQVLGPLLGVRRGDDRLEFVPELRDLAASLEACDADGGVLFTLQAPAFDDLVDVAERGEVMSAKTTYVQPKPRTGLFLG